MYRLRLWSFLTRRYAWLWLRGKPSARCEACGRGIWFVWNRKRESCAACAGPLRITMTPHGYFFRRPELTQK
jgi:hypothetical protein